MLVRGVHFCDSTLQVATILGTMVIQILALVTLFKEDLLTWQLNQKESVTK